MEPLLYETHSHTPFCKHASGLPTEYAACAGQRGLRGLVVTCHNPMPDGFAAHVRMDLRQLDEYVSVVQQTRQEWQGKVDVRLGLEADFLPGHEGWLERQLASHPFDYVLGSVHPNLPEYRSRYWSNDPLECQVSYFELLAEAAETRLFDCLSHPDLIKNETMADWCPARILPTVRRVLDRIAATGVALELNTSGVNKEVAEMNPFREMLVEIHQRHIPVVVGADAHQPSRVADQFEIALDLLCDIGFEEQSLFVQRRRYSIPIHVARQTLCRQPTISATR